VSPYFHGSTTRDATPDFSTQHRVESTRDDAPNFNSPYLPASPAGDSALSDLSRPEVEGRWPAVVTDPNTGGRKGSKLARFDMIPPDVLWELAEHYGRGEAIYPSDPHPNWQRGYSWRLSVAALHRHLSQWESGEDTDAETGSSHLIAVMWHCVALRWFQLHNRGTDYR
jgi:hypothetical protein